jgi:3,4-dihydroxy 2-butanone 4-phosphate synthase/GTP cyclohydrolase II
MTITAFTVLPTEFGDFQLRSHAQEGEECLSLSAGDITTGTPVVRLHSACFFGERLHSLHCDCAQQLQEALRLIQQQSGVFIYSLGQEGRGIGLEKKMDAMETQRTQNCDTVEAFAALGLDRSDYRTYDAAVRSLQELSVARTIRLFSGNPQKIEALEKAGYTIVELIRLQREAVSTLAQQEIRTKKDKLGYRY